MWRKHLQNHKEHILLNDSVSAMTSTAEGIIFIPRSKIYKANKLFILYEHQNSAQNIYCFFILILTSFYVQAACTLDIKSKNTAAFINEIPQLNTALQNCPVPLDGTSKMLLGSNEIVKLSILKTDENTAEAFFTITSSNLAGLSSSGTSYGFNIVIDEYYFDAILSSDNKYVHLHMHIHRAKLKL